MKNYGQAREIIIRIFNSSYYRKSTIQEIKQIKDITKEYGDSFVQSWYRQAAIANLENKKLHWAIRLRKKLLINGSWKFNAWLRDVTAWLEVNV